MWEQAEQEQVLEVDDIPKLMDEHTDRPYILEVQPLLEHTSEREVRIVEIERIRIW